MEHIFDEENLRLYDLYKEIIEYLCIRIKDKKIISTQDYYQKTLFDIRDMFYGYFLKSSWYLRIETKNFAKEFFEKQYTNAAIFHTQKYKEFFSEDTDFNNFFKKNVNLNDTEFTIEDLDFMDKLVNQENESENNNSIINNTNDNLMEQSEKITGINCKILKRKIYVLKIKDEEQLYEVYNKLFNSPYKMDKVSGFKQTNNNKDYYDLNVRFKNQVTYNKYKFLVDISENNLHTGINAYENLKESSIEIELDTN